MVSHTYNPSIEEDEAGGLPHVWSYFNLHNKFHISLEWEENIEIFCECQTFKYLRTPIKDNYIQFLSISQSSILQIKKLVL